MNNANETYTFKFGATVALNAPAGCAFPINHPDIYQSIDWLSAHSFDSIEIHIPNPDMIDRVKVKEYLEAKHLSASSIGTGLAVAYENLTITSPDADIRNRAVERLKSQVELGGYLNCPVIIGSMRGNIPQGETFKETQDRMVDSCKRLMDYADSLDTDVVIEAIDRSETNYLYTAEDVLEIIDLVGSRHLKVHLDTFHMNIEETDWEKPVLKCKEKLGHVHVADNTRLYPGSGMIDFVPFLRALKAVNYGGSLVFECYPGKDGYEACLLGREHLRKCIEKL